jgi:hypothetical protein
MTALILNDRGEPQPPTHVLERLTSVHAGLGLRHTPHNGPVWAITMAWGPEDRRWEYVQNGTAPASRAFDIIGYLPIACPPDEAASYVATVFRQSSRADVQRMADDVLRHNTTAPAAAMVEEAIAEVLDMPDPSSVQPRRRGRPRKVI